MKHIKATQSSLQDPKQLAVLKAIVGSPYYIANNWNGIFFAVHKDIFFCEWNYDPVKQGEIRIPIDYMVLEPRLLIGEGVDFQYRLFDGPEEIWFNSESGAIHSFIKRNAVIRLSEETLKEIGFEIVGIE